jgi:chromosome segregation protein
MESADALYGVSMRGDGITQVISQRIRERPDTPTARREAIGAGQEPVAAAT